MLSPDVLYLIAVEQHHDRLKELAHQELVRAAELNNPAPQTYRRLVYQFVHLLRQWGTKLENYGNTRCLQPEQCC